MYLEVQSDSKFGYISSKVVCGQKVWLLLAAWPSRLSSPWKKSRGIVNWKEMRGMALPQFRIQSMKCFIYIRSQVITHNPLLSGYHSVICKVCSALLSLLLCLSAAPSRLSVSLGLLHAHTYILKIHGSGSPSVLHNFFTKTPVFVLFFLWALNEFKEFNVT